MKLHAVFFGLSLALPVHAHKVVGVSDGATLTLLVDERPVKVRLANIDAPDKAQAFGDRSKQSLAALCRGKDATYKELDVDRHGRSVALVHCDGVEVNRAQIERGMAWVYPKTNQDLTLPGLEAMARRDRRGLWVDPEPVAPWEFRRPQIKKVRNALPKSSVEGMCFIDRHGEYRVVDGRKLYGC